MRTRARLDKGRCARVLIPAAAGERGGKSEARKRDDSDERGLQLHGCEFVTGVTIEARGGGHTEAKGGK
jgi:hypothetical protein